MVAGRRDAYNRRIHTEATMATVIIKATDIEDTRRWREGFAKNAERRRAHGFLSHVMYTDPSAPGTIVIVSQVESLARARGLLTDSAVRETMIAHGAKKPPEVMFLEELA
jgi:hypothetical protein